MYPVAGGTVRNPKKDVLLGGKYLIPKGTTIFLPVRLERPIFKLDLLCPTCHVWLHSERLPACIGRSFGADTLWMPVYDAYQW